MNALTHTKINLDLLQKAKITNGKANLVIAGGVLPDLSCFGMLPSSHTHNKNREFIKYLKKSDPALVGFGIGFMLHGERPKGLDWFAHNSKGFIAKHKKAVSELVFKQKLHMGKLNLDQIAHHLMEFSCDTLVEPKVAEHLNKAFSCLPIYRIAEHLSKFFNSDIKKIRKTLRFLKRFDFHNLHSNKAIANVVQKYIMYERLGKNGGANRHLILIERFNFANYFKISKVIKQTCKIIRKDFKEFTEKTSKKMQARFLPKIKEALK